MSEFRYEIVGFREIPVNDIEPNPNNPRPSWHVEEDDPELVELADSIATTGQHRPALVFELSGHYNIKDNPDNYLLLQGERRWRACKLGGVETLRCLVVKTPQSEVEEWAWLGNEEGFKVEWGQFFVMRYAQEQALRMDVPITDRSIQSMTGLSATELETAQAVFNLHPDIQTMVEEYEQVKYERRVRGDRRAQGRLGKNVTAAGEFSPAKAAEVWRIFSLLRRVYGNICKDFSDYELQYRIASKKDTHDDLREFHAGLANLDPRNLPSGTVTLVASFLSDEKVTARTAVHRGGNAQRARLKNLLEVCDKTINASNRLTKTPDQLGNNPEELLEAKLTLERASLALDRLAHRVDRRLTELG